MTAALATQLAHSVEAATLIKHLTYAAKLEGQAMERLSQHAAPGTAEHEELRERWYATVDQVCECKRELWTWLRAHADCCCEVSQ